MKTPLLILTLEAASLLAHAQGTINFGNSLLTPMSVRLFDGTQRLATAEDGLFIGAFYGPAGSVADSLVLAPGLATIGSTAGVMSNAPRVFSLPGTEPAQVVSLQIRVWDSALGPDGWHEAPINCAGRFYGVTPIEQVTLGLSEGPGATIWQTAISIAPNRFKPLVVYACPEPSIVVLTALAGFTWFTFRRRRKAKA